MSRAVAVYTELDLEHADRIARAHGLGPASKVEGVLAGSVNSNFFVDTEVGRRFVRVYEEQDVDGLRYEHALLAHLAGAGLPVPRVVPGPPPGDLRVAGKPIAVFEVIGGDEICQAGVTPDHTRAVGTFLAQSHAAAETFAIRKAGRFGRAQIRERLEGVAALGRPELAEAVPALFATLDELDATEDEGLPRGVIHGDLFRDNVRWEEGAIVGALDWESASDGPYVYDLAVAMLAWCYGDALEERLWRAMIEGYAAVRPLGDEELAGLRHALIGAATRFTVTRISDFHLREDSAQVKKDWRRFWDRLSAVRGLELSA